MTDYFGAMGTALFTTLSGGTPLTSELGGTVIYAGHAPDNASLPYVVYSHQGGGPENINSSDLRSDVWNVRGYAATRPQANRIDGQIEALLHRQTITVSGYNTFWLVREENYSLDEQQPDKTWVYTAGGLYRVRLTG